MAKRNKAHFQSHNLVVTVLDPPYDWPGPDVYPCPSGTCCMPPSATCFYSLLTPRGDGLSPEDLGRLVVDLRDKLGAEKRGIDVVVRGTRAQSEEWKSILKTILKPVDTVEPGPGSKKGPDR